MEEIITNYKREDIYNQEKIAELMMHYREILRLLGEDPDREGLIKTPERVAKAMSFVTKGYTQDPIEIINSATFKEDYKILNHEIRNHGTNIPPLVNAYMSLSPTMKMFGTAINREFGDVEESGILLAVDEILEEKKERHIGTYNGK